jgi:hypothetical protein
MPGEKLTGIDRISRIKAEERFKISNPKSKI